MVRRRSGWLLAVVCLTAGAWADGEIVGLSGDTNKLLAKAFRHEKLSRLLERNSKVDRLRREGDFKAAAAEAHAIAEAVANTPVTQFELGARAVAVAMERSAEGELLGLAGQLHEAHALLAKAEQAEVPKDVQAALRACRGYLDALDLNFSEATDHERRAVALAKSSFFPVLAEARALFEGNAASALTHLKPLTDKGATGAQCLYYSGLAALAAGQVQEARGYLGRVEKNLGYLPGYYLAQGLLAGAEGNYRQAAELFLQAAGREHGRLQRGAFCSAVASLALGDIGPGQRALALAVGNVPTNYRLLGQELLLAPTAENAKLALRNPTWWWSYRGYPGGGFSAQPAAAPKKETPATAAPGGASSIGPASAGEQPPAKVEVPGGPGVPPAPTTAAPAPAAAPPPAPNGLEPALEAGPALEVDQRANSSQATAAWCSAVRLLQAGRVAEARATLESCVRIWPGLAEGWLALGHARLLLGLPDAALVAYRHAGELRPEWPEPPYGQALAAQRLGRQAEAADLFRRALLNGLTGPAAQQAQAAAR